MNKRKRRFEKYYKYFKRSNLALLNKNFKNFELVFTWIVNKKMDDYICNRFDFIIRSCNVDKFKANLLA